MWRVEMINNVPSKSLLTVRRVKGRVSPPEKVFAAIWLHFSAEFRNFALKFR